MRRVEAHLWGRGRVSLEMELLLPGRFGRAATAYGYQRVIFEQVAAGARSPPV